MQLAVKTLQAIEDEFVRTQGGSWRELMGKIIMDSPDAFRAQESGHRGHMGCSQLGGACDRALWYNYHWVKDNKFNGQALRIFNLGHLTEPMMIAMLQSIGCEVTQVDSTGKQIRVSHGAFIGGSTDGTAIGVPDLPAGERCLLEFKTANEKSFTKIAAKGVRLSKEEHYIQMCLYMAKTGLRRALYMVYCKNNSALHAEIVEANDLLAGHYFERGMRIVHNGIPGRISNNPDKFECKYCDFLGICHGSEPIDKTCRTCQHGTPNEELSTWVCNRHMAKLSKERQLVGCKDYLGVL
jgi:hypothetical protein